MKIWTTILAVLAIAAMTAAAPAADKPAKADKAAQKAEKKKKKAPTLKGSVVKVDGSKLVISSGKKNEPKEEVTVETNDKTVVTVNGQAAKLADLKPGQRVVISPETGTAEKIEVRAPKAKKDAK